LTSHLKKEILKRTIIKIFLYLQVHKLEQITARSTVPGWKEKEGGKKDIKLINLLALKTLHSPMTVFLVCADQDSFSGAKGTLGFLIPLMYNFDLSKYKYASFTIKIILMLLEVVRNHSVTVTKK
jgi:hypothetical protein